MTPNTVLIIDDEPNFIATLEADLELDGYIVQSSADPIAGLRYVESYKPDIILIDWEMPKISGIELVKRIRQENEHRTRYIIMLTGRTGTENIVRALDAGADDFLSKPFNTDELRARIRSGLRIRLLEERIAEESKSIAMLDMALSIADKIGNPIAAAKFYHQSLIQNPNITNNGDVRESLEILGQLLDETLGLIGKFHSIKSSTDIKTEENNHKKI